MSLEMCFDFMALRVRKIVEFFCERCFWGRVKGSRAEGSDPVDPLKARPPVEITVEAENRSNAVDSSQSMESISIPGLQPILHPRSNS